MKNTGYGIQRRRAPLRCLCMVLCVLFAGLPAVDAVGITARAATSYTVTFHGNGGKFGTTSTAKETSEKTVTEGNTVTAPSITPSRTGYKFTTGEWYREPECTNKWIVGTGGDVVTEDIILYAKWTPKTYKVYFRLTNSTTGTIYETIDSQEYGGTLQAPEEPTKEGYTFDGWYADTKYEQEWNFNEPFTPEVTSSATSVSIYAKWKPNIYTVKFMDGEEVLSSQQVEYNTAVSKPSPNPEKEGCTFVNWYKDPEFKSMYSFVSKITGDTMIYAKWTTNKYTVTFDSQGGSSVAAQRNIEHGNKCTEPGPPTKSAHTFGGWYKDAECTQPWDFEFDTVTDNITLYAKWETSVYTVTFDSDGGTAVRPQEISHGGTVTRPDDPIKEHYDFEKWVASSTSSTAYDFDTLVTKDMTLYAKWTLHKYTITFDSMGGSEVAPKLVEYGSTISTTSKPKPARTGYTFGGWFTDKEYNNEWVFGSSTTANVSKVTEDTTLYAKWTANEYTVSFDPNGGKFGSSTTAKKVNFCYDSIIVIPNTVPNPTRDGHTFTEKWYTDKECTTEWDFEKGIVKGAMTLYAGWKIKTYTVTFDADGGTPVESQAIIYNEVIPESPVTTRVGYTFGGWFTDKTYSSTKEWKFGTSSSPKKVTDDVTLYAKWTPIKYKVTLDYNGGSYNGASSKVIDVAYDSLIDSKNAPSGMTFKYDGHTFANEWYTDKECTQGKQWNFAVDKVKGDMTLYAKWTINGYTVTFYSNGEILSEVGVEHGKKVAQPGDPTNEGKEFVGWVTSSGGSTLFDFNEPITKNTKVYAKWPTSTSQKIYIVNFSKNGHGTTTSKSGLEIGQLLDKPTDPTATGYTFGGWYKDAACSDEQKWNFDTDTVQRSQILYAKWTINTYQVSFDQQGGSAVDPQMVQYNQKATAPIDPVKEGYTFGGWYKEEACTTPWSFDTDVVTADTILYAKWTEVVVVPEKYTVSFDMNGHGSAIVSLKDVESGSRITAPTAPTADGWTFEGWYKDEACETAWSFDTDVVTEDTILHAKWTEVVVVPEKYTVSFDMNGHGSAIADLKDVESGSRITAPTAPAEDGWTFEGWYREGTCENAWSFDTDVVTENTTLYAKWTKADDPGNGDHDVIVGDDTPAVEVGGLDDVVEAAKDENPGATNVKITMTVEKKEETELPPAAQEIKKEAPSSATLEYLDIGIEKDVDGTKNAINSTSTVIEVKIKFDFSGKTEVNIYREHEGIITRFTENDSKIDSTFILDKTNGFIHIFTQKFSVYAISYKEESTSGGGSTGGSGGGSTGPVSYMITASAGEGGSISPGGSIRVVSYGDLTLTITPEEGYQIADVLVDGKSVGPLSGYTFKNVLAAHSIHAVFEPVEAPTPPEPGCPKDESCPAWPYIDVNIKEWYHDGIHYCLETGLMNGYTADRFGPGDSLTRAQLAQILYNLAGKPLVSGSSGFHDVPAGAWYAQAVAWAREAGVVSGYSDTRFAPNALITREQLAAMIWRYAGSPEAPELALSFEDAGEVSGYAGSALRWAVAKGIVSGNNGRLEPGKPAARAEAASMIMRFCTEN